MNHVKNISNVSNASETTNKAYYNQEHVALSKTQKSDYSIPDTAFLYPEAKFHGGTQETAGSRKQRCRIPARAAPHSQ